MFSKKTHKGNVQLLNDNVNLASTRSVPSIIVSDLNIKGDLVSEGAIEVGGKVTGNIKCKQVTIRKGADIIGDIESSFLTINGNVNGNVKAENLTITSTGHIKGSVEYGYLSVEAGANIECSLKKVSFKSLEKIKENDGTSNDNIEYIPRIEAIIDNLRKEEEGVENDGIKDVSEKKKPIKKKAKKISSKN